MHSADSGERIERRNGGRFLQVEEPHDLQEDFMLVEARSLGFAWQVAVDLVGHSGTAQQQQPHWS